MARVAFFERVTFPGSERRLLEGLTVRPTRAICFLADIADGYERAGAFTYVAQVGAARIRRVLPEGPRAL